MSALITELTPSPLLSHNPFTIPLLPESVSTALGTRTTCANPECQSLTAKEGFLNNLLRQSKLHNMLYHHDRWNQGIDPSNNSVDKELTAYNYHISQKAIRKSRKLMFQGVESVWYHHYIYWGVRVKEQYSSKIQH